MLTNITDNTNSIFETDLWLNCVAENSWERIEIKNNNGIVDASFPVYKTQKMGCKLLTVPPLTQTLGIYLRDTGAKLTKKIEREKKLIIKIIDTLPEGYNYDFFLDIDNEYSLPFIWKGFKLEPHFSYRLENLSDLDYIWNGFKENIKTDIRKAQKQVEVIRSSDIESLIRIQEKTFERQKRRLPYDKNIIRKINNVMQDNNKSIYLCAVDSKGNIHAAAYFVFDHRRCYYLLGGGDPLYRNSGASSLLLWEGIKYSTTCSKVFDFEGSMIEPIEKFIRGFGARPRVYYRARKMNLLLETLDSIKPKAKKILGYK